MSVLVDVLSCIGLCCNTNLILCYNRNTMTTPELVDNKEFDAFELQTDALNELATQRKRPVILVNGDLDRETTIAVQNFAKHLENYKELSVLLNSPGGFIESAYKMLLGLRLNVDEIEVLVPEWAKSAATLFCLGADTIYLGPDGELGPLDPQILDRGGSARPISALESFKALEQLLRHSLESFDSIVQLLLHRAPMDIPHAIDHAKPLFAAVVSPLYQQIDPHELGEAGRYLSEGEEYAVRVMRRWGYKCRDEVTIRQIAHNLVWNYPSHGFVIDCKEALELG